MSTVLVVDDDTTFIGLLRTVFELEGYRVELTTHPDEVTSIARRVKPALVLMDVHVGPGDTIDVLRELRAEEALRDTRVIMVSGLDRSLECEAAGADAFILKPFRPSELLEIVAKTISI